MFDMMVSRVEPEIPDEVLAVDPGFGRKMVVLGRALTDGFYVAASAGDEIDFMEFADLSSAAINALIAREVQRVSSKGE